MKNAMFCSILLLSTGLAGHAGVVLTLDPPDGVVQGTPGSIVGWGFTLTADDTNWISVVTTALVDETNPSVGTYNDFAGPLGGPVNGVMAPGAASWTLPFDLIDRLGLAAYVISENTVIGAVDTGVIDLNYELFSADPNTCPTCATGFADVQAPFEVDVVAPAAAAPEPEPEWLLGAALLLLGSRCRSRRKKAGRRTDA